MPTSLKEMMEAANAAVPKIAPKDAVNLMRSADVLVVDVRDAPELQAAGKVRGAAHVPRGMLEFRADPESPAHDPCFSREKTVLVYCGSGAGLHLPARP